MPACVDRPKIFSPKTVKIDSRVLITRTDESITPPYPRKGNVRGAIKEKKQLISEVQIAIICKAISPGWAHLRAIAPKNQK